MEDRKKFWETNKHLLVRDKIITTLLSYSKKNETDQLFNIGIITAENTELLTKIKEPVTKFYLFNNSLSEIIDETLGVSQDFICFYRVSSTNLNSQLDNSIETEESDIGLRTNLLHGYNTCGEKPDKVQYISDKDIKILYSKDVTYYYSHNGEKIHPKKNLHFYGIDYPKYDMGTVNKAEIYNDKINVLVLIQVIDYMFKLCTEKSKSTIICGEIFRNCPADLVIYYFWEISKKYMFVSRVFLAFNKNYNAEQYNILKKIETTR